MSEYKIDYCHHDSVTAESRQYYIKREDAIEKIDEMLAIQDSIDNVVADKKLYTEMLLNDIPTADVVDVVRCKDCVKRHDGCPMQVWCGTGDDDYCSRGERK